MRLKNILNSISQRRIVLLSFILLVLLILFIYLIFVIPLAERSETTSLEVIDLQNKLGERLEEQENSRREIPKSSELAQALGFVQDYLELNAVTVEEINITQLSAQESAGFKQALIKIRVNGDNPKILRIIGQIVQDNKFPSIVQEVDVGKTTEISLKLLYRNTEDT